MPPPVEMVLPQFSYAVVHIPVKKIEGKLVRIWRRDCPLCRHSRGFLHYARRVTICPCAELVLR
jgi:hypothetical protein